jgi:hypothetical protein
MKRVTAVNAALKSVRFSLPQVARRLGVPVAAARELVISGPIDGILCGREILVTGAALNRYIASIAPLRAA